MSLLKNYKLGVVLAVIVIVMFLIVNWFFVNQHYYTITKYLNSFVIPPIFVLLTLMGLMQLKKTKKGRLTFKEGFTFCYINQLIGGVLSLAFILLYMNVLSPSTRDIFNYQLFDDLYKQQLKEFNESEIIVLPGLTEEQSKIEAEKVIQNLKNKRDNLSENVLSLSNGKLWGFVFGMNLFYIFISIFLALFFKTPKTIEDY